MTLDPSPPERLALGTLAGGVSAGPRRPARAAETRRADNTQTVSRRAGPGLRWLRAELDRREARAAFDAAPRPRRDD